jgi:hypothetical protein
MIGERMGGGGMEEDMRQSSERARELAAKRNAAAENTKNSATVSGAELAQRKAEMLNRGKNTETASQPVPDLKKRRDEMLSLGKDKTPDALAFFKAPEGATGGDMTTVSKERAAVLKRRKEVVAGKGITEGLAVGDVSGAEDILVEKYRNDPSFKKDFDEQPGILNRRKSVEVKVTDPIAERQLRTERTKRDREEDDARVLQEAMEREQAEIQPQAEATLMQAMQRRVNWAIEKLTGRKSA